MHCLLALRRAHFLIGQSPGPTLCPLVSVVSHASNVYGVPILLDSTFERGLGVDITSLNPRARVRVSRPEMRKPPTGLRCLDDPAEGSRKAKAEKERNLPGLNGQPVCVMCCSVP